MAESLIASARQSLHRNDTDAAYTCLTEAFTRNANAPGLMPALLGGLVSTKDTIA